MRDESATVGLLRQKVAEFIAEREWEQFHHPRDLAIGISLEASELLEHFQWDEKRPLEALRHDGKLVREVSDEMSDILHYLLTMANVLEIDLAEAFADKMRRNAEKYPAALAGGRRFHAFRRGLNGNGRTLTDDEL